MGVRNNFHIIFYLIVLKKVEGKGLSGLRLEGRAHNKHIRFSSARKKPKKESRPSSDIHQSYTIKVSFHFIVTESCSIKKIVFSFLRFFVGIEIKIKQPQSGTTGKRGRDLNDVRGGNEIST